MHFQKLKENYKQIVIFLAMFLIVHAVKLIVYLPTYDSVYGFSLIWTDGVDQGRWLRSALNNILSSPYDLHWVEGSLASFFLSCCLYYLLKIFELNKNKLAAGVSSALFVTFPSITAIYAYGFWLPSFTLGLLLSIIAVFVLLKTDFGRGMRGWLLSAAFFVASLSIYQIYFSFALIIAIVYVAFALLKNADVEDLKKRTLYTIIVFAVSAVAYLIVNKIVMAILQTEYQQYQGFSSFGILSLKQYGAAFYKMIVSFIVFFVPITKVTFYGILNAIIAIMIVALVVKEIICNKALKLWRRILICALLVSVPFVAYCFYFVSADMWYHGIMELGNYFVYFLLLLLALGSTSQRKLERIMKSVALGLLIVLSFYNFINTNVAYKQMEISYSRTEFSAQEILYDIDALEPETDKIAIVGAFPRRDHTIEAIPRVNAAYPSIFLTHPFHFVQYANYYCGREFVACTEEEIDEIVASEQFKEMKPYPSNRCVAIIEDTIVVYLSADE